MGSSQRRSCRQHTAARQAAGHAALPEPRGLPATSEGAKGSHGRPRKAPCPFYPMGTHSDPKQSRAAEIQAHPSHRALERGRTARPRRRGGCSPGTQHRTREKPGRRGQDGPGREARRGPRCGTEAGRCNRASPSSPWGRGENGRCSGAVAPASVPGRAGGAQRPRRLRLWLWLLAGLRRGRAHAYKRLIQANTPHILNELHLAAAASVGLGAAGLRSERRAWSPPGQASLDGARRAPLSMGLSAAAAPRSGGGGWARPRGRRAWPRAGGGRAVAAGTAPSRGAPPRPWSAADRRRRRETMALHKLCSVLEGRSRGRHGAPPRGDRGTPGGAAPSAAPRCPRSPPCADGNFGAGAAQGRPPRFCRGCSSRAAAGAPHLPIAPPHRTAPRPRGPAPRPPLPGPALPRTQRCGAGSGPRLPEPSRGRAGDPHPSRAAPCPASAGGRPRHLGTSGLGGSSGGDTSAPRAWEVPAAGTPPYPGLEHFGFGGVPACRKMGHSGSDPPPVTRIFPRHTGGILRSSFHSKNTLCFRDSPDELLHTVQLITLVIGNKVCFQQGFHKISHLSHKLHADRCLPVLFFLRLLNLVSNLFLFRGKQRSKAPHPSISLCYYLYSSTMGEGFLLGKKSWCDT